MKSKKDKTFKHFSKAERGIISLLYVAGTEVSTRSIAMQLDMHLLTAKKYLIRLRKRGWVFSHFDGNRFLWEFNFMRWKTLKEKEVKHERR